MNDPYASLPARIPPPIPTSAQKPPARPPYGPWATAGLTLFVYGVATLVQGVVVAVAWTALYVMYPGREPAALLEDLGTNGDIVAVMLLLGSPCGALAVVAVVALRRGPSLRRYLALKPVATGTLLNWCLTVVVLEVAGNLAIAPFQSEHSDAVRFMTELYSSATIPVLLWLGVIVVAPVFEEVLFRGFMFTGLARSRMGVSGAIFVTSLLWALIHMQYDPLVVGMLFLFGIALGAARQVTGSLYVPIAMHMAWNGVATALTELYLG